MKCYNLSLVLCLPLPSYVDIRVWELSAKGNNVIMDVSRISTCKTLCDFILQRSDILTVCMIRHTGQFFSSSATDLQRSCL